MAIGSKGERDIFCHLLQVIPGTKVSTNTIKYSHLRRLICIKLLKGFTMITMQAILILQCINSLERERERER